MACVSAHAAGIREYYADTADGGFLDNTEIQWFLTDVSIDGNDTGFNRDELNGTPNGDEIFSLKFDRGILYGMGAPNRFSGPYSTGGKQTLKIMPIRSTLMASIFEPEGLKEHYFFSYLQNAYKWARLGNRLEIYSKTGDQEIVMTFVREE